VSARISYLSSRPALYVHIPFCEAKCPYCAFYSEPISCYDPAEMIRAILIELKQKSFYRPFATAYLGGGSPAILPRSLLFELIDGISAEIPADAEFTIEVNPDQVKYELLKDLRSLGVNRLSIGAQSFIDDELKFLGRCYNAQTVEMAVNTARKAQFENISLDLIYAIPQSNSARWRENLRKAIALSPQHISAYSLCYEPGTLLYADLKKGNIRQAEEETDRQMYEITIDMLARAGFEQYEISNFAMSGFTCRHNLTYWLNEPYIGIGPAAHSCYRRVRSANVSDIRQYIEKIRHDKNACIEWSELTDEQFACETAVLNLRLSDGIDVKRFKALTGIDVSKAFGDVLKKYTSLGLIEEKQGRIALTGAAMPIADSILCDFSSFYTEPD